MLFVLKDINRLWKHLVWLRLGLNGIEIDQFGGDIYMRFDVI